MLFNIKESIKILERTPAILETLLLGLNEKWILNNEGAATWSPFDVVGHLIHGEKTDWVPRMMIILSEERISGSLLLTCLPNLKTAKGKTCPELLAEFKRLRFENLRILGEITLTDERLNKKGIHPELGEVTLRQLLATWVVHDLGHLTQITRVMAKQYKEEMGAWTKYFSIFNNT